MENREKTEMITLPTAECHGIKDLPTPIEKEYLDAMREIKERVRTLKSSRKSASTEASSIDQELADLKSRWNVLEKKWEAAVKDRMIRLGHEEV